MNPTRDPIRILFVEDSFDQAMLVRAFLAIGGNYRVTHSQDGDHAVNLIEDADWDMLITDLNLPGQDGFDVIRAARAKNPEIPVLATTGYTAAHYEEEALRAGADEVMHKPLDKEEFLGRVEALLGTNTPTATQQADTILAIGGLVGDVEMGAGGTLMAAAASGCAVTVVPVIQDPSYVSEAGLEGARQAASLLGVDLRVDTSAFGDAARQMGIVERIVDEIAATRVYAPAMDESHPSRMEAFRIAKIATGSVDNMLGYQTATTGFDFRPTHFVDISGGMVMKMEALAAYHAAGAGRIDLTPRLVQAYARYWGRMHRFSEVEAFEVVSGSV